MRKGLGYDGPTPDPEAHLTDAAKEIRRELLKSERPVTTAAIEIARLRALLAGKDRK